MANDRIYLEETHSASVAVSKLLFFFKRFFTPYIRSITLTVILAFCVTGTDLLLPQLLRIVIDKHLIVNARKIAPDEAPGTGSGFVKTHRQSFIPCAEKNCYFILPDELTNFQEQELKLLEEARILMPEKYYFTKADPQNIELSQKYADLFYCAGDYLFIAYSSLHKLNKKELACLRADDYREIVKISGAFVIILVLGFLFNFSQVYLVEFTSQKIMHDIRTNIFTHLQSLSLSFFTRNPVGRLVTRATNDVHNLHEMFSALFANILKDLFIILGIMGVLFWVNWQLSLVCFALLPFLIGCTAIFSLKSRTAFREVRIKIAAINSFIQENISGISVVKSFSREKLNEINFQKLNHDNYRANMNQTTVFAVFTPVIDLTRLSAMALIIWYGGGKVIQDSISLGTLVVFLYYMRMFFRPIQDLAEKYNIIQSAFASLERIYLLLMDRNVIKDPALPQKPEGINGNIEFNNVSFYYNENEPVLNDVSFSVGNGEAVAIVGPTGAGKTTIIKLLERSYDVQKGSICIGGTDVCEMGKSFLRSQIGLVMQDVFLFAGTIRSNITLGNNSFSDKEVEEALKISNADSFVKRLPAGMNTEVTEGGKTLSAGERQLLSFARAILINPKILILDEATSNIDPLTEGLIQDALEKIMQQRTSLVIAHRFSTIRKADRIIVLHKGHIHEQGTHDELMQKQGLYYRLALLQYIK